MKEIQLQSQTGRSMVEMLGVLSIIGVLSIGGIAGYRYAMDQMTMNKIYNLIDTVAVAASIELKTNNSESLFQKDGLTNVERALLFCDNYNSEFCSNPDLDSNSYIYLSHTFSGNHPLNGTTADSSGKVLWSISRYDIAPTSCYCKSDLALNIININSGKCAELIDLTINKYGDVLVGFSGSNHASIALSNDQIKKTICYRDGDIKDETTSIALTLVFRGPEENECGRCYSPRCPCQ